MLFFFKKKNKIKIKISGPLAKQDTKYFHMHYIIFFPVEYTNETSIQVFLSAYSATAELI